MIGTSDQSCWLAEACKILVWGVSGDRKPTVGVTVGTTVSLLPITKCEKFASCLRNQGLGTFYPHRPKDSICKPIPITRYRLGLVAGQATVMYVSTHQTNLPTNRELDPLVLVPRVSPSSLTTRVCL